MNLPDIKAEFEKIWQALGNRPDPEAPAGVPDYEKLALTLAQFKVGIDELFRRTAGDTMLPADLGSWLAANPDKDPARSMPHDPLREGEGGSREASAEG